MRLLPAYILSWQQRVLQHRGGGEEGVVGDEGFLVQHLVNQPDLRPAERLC